MYKIITIWILNCAESCPRYLCVLYLAIHDLEADYSSDLYFSIKPLPTESKNMVPLLIRTQWKYTRWRKISFTILVEDRQDF